jgi:hypothetical protein
MKWWSSVKMIKANLATSKNIHSFLKKNASILFATILECNFKNLVIQKSSGIWQLENAKNTFFLSFSPRKQITIVVKLGHRKQYNF